SLAIQADGRIVVAGETSSDFALARYNADGSPDAGFGSNGLVTTDFAASGDVAHSLAIQADGRIVVVGESDEDFALARYEGMATPQKKISAVIAKVQAFVASGSLNNGQGNSLLVKLQAATQQLDGGKVSTAVNQLQAFINQTKAFIDSKVLSEEEGKELVDTATDISSELSGRKMFWTDTGTHKIQRANLDGSAVEDLVTTGLSFPDGIAVDVVNGHIYWTNGGVDDKIQRANLDGTDIKDLVSGLSQPSGIGLDLVNGKMYWTDTATDKIQRANLDGTSVEDLVTTGLSTPFGIALDVVNGKIYWTDRDINKIQRANLDGSNIETLITFPFGDLRHIALDVVNGKMYWADVGVIRRANLDGTTIETLVSGLSGPFGIALDADNGKMYWTNGGVDDKIQRANLDGSAVQDLVTTGLDSPRGIALGIESQRSILRSSGQIATRQSVSKVPTKSALYQNHPNPFNPTTSIGFNLPEASKVKLAIYDINGREVRTLVNESQSAGEQRVVWDGLDQLGRKVISGIYIYRIQTGEYVQSRKMLLIR
ncbi:MAG: DUF5050 domain-containing protein, partial [Anaerolineae bacterium]|nr:DUF5050 domain-containing protein [Anaerolineae bacterium]